MKSVARLDYPVSPEVAQVSEFALPGRSVADKRQPPPVTSRIAGESTARMVAVREAYAGLRDRCLAEHPEDAAYINGLYGDWAARLAEIPDYPEHREPYIAHLIRELGHPEAPVMEWLDAFPSAVDAA